MKKIFFLLLFNIIISSCGRNPYLEADIRSITGIEVDNREIQAEISDPFIDFGVILEGKLLTKEVQIFNSGVVDIYNMDMVWNENVNIDLDNCQVLKVRETCSAKINLDTNLMSSGIYNNLVSLQLNNSNSFLNFYYKVEIESETTESGIVTLNYLQGKTINLGKVYKKTKYRKLISLNPNGHLIEINGFSSTDSTQFNVISSTENNICKNTFSKDCFIELVFTPKKLEEIKEQVTISYTDLVNSTSHELKIKIVANVKRREKCFEQREEAIVVKNEGELNQYELALSYPYYDSLETSNIRLEKVLNNAFTQEVDIYNEILRYNQDTQVRFSYPLIDSDSVVSAQLLIDLLKYEDVQDDSSDTEVLCSLDLQRCSGKRFVNSRYRELINLNFEIKNNKFSKILMHKDKRWNFFSYKNSLDLNEYLKIGKKELQTMSKNNSMSFVVADDVMLNTNPILILKKFEKIECR